VTVDEKELTEKQRRVLEAAIDVFAEKGFAGASTAEIAKKAGVAEGTIFKTYKTKKELLIGAVAPLFARILAPTLVDPVVEIMKTPYPRVEDFLRALWQDRVGVVRAHPRLVRIAMQELPFQSEVQELMKQTVLQQVWPHAKVQIERFQQLGQIREAPPSSIFRMIMGMFVSYAAQRMIIAPDRTQAEDDVEIELMVAVLSKGLRPD
jgi:AcrR family transcriptional regulator